MKVKQLIAIAGGLWVFIGTMLILRGGYMYQLAAEQQQATQAAILISLAAGICLGSFKGLFVLSKTARRNKSRIQNLPNPVRLYDIFSKPFYFLIVGMIALGVSLRTWNEYIGGYIVVAAIYCGIGMALIVGSRVYWFHKSEAVPENP